MDTEMHQFEKQKQPCQGQNFSVVCSVSQTRKPLRPERQPEKM